MSEANNLALKVETQLVRTKKNYSIKKTTIDIPFERAKSSSAPTTLGTQNDIQTLTKPCPKA